MADALTALNSDVTVAYLDESRQKRIYYTGTSQRYTANALYSALMDHFDEPARMDNPSPMSAQTPTEYTVGTIDTGDNEPWYISYRLMEKIYGGAVKTAGWARDPFPGDGSGTVGIICVPITNVDIDVDDEGDTISHASGDSGTLLEFIDTGGATDYLIIRPDTNALSDDFDTGSGTLTMGTSANTATQTAASVTTGEQIWANLYSIGTIEDDTHIYLYQGAASDDATRVRVYAQNSATQDYWANGHLDLCVPLKDYTSTSNPIIDGGYLTAFARKGTTEYAHFEVANSTTSGGRNPVPLGTKSDLNNTAGTGNMIWDNGSTDTLVDLETLYNIGTVTTGNIAAGVLDDSGFVDDTADLASSTAADVVLLPTTTANDDAFYFGMEELWNYLVIDISSAATATAAGTTWEYYDGSTWSALTVTDDSDSANGFGTDGTGRYVVSWDIPSDWTQTTVTSQPAALNKVFYVRIRVSNSTNYTEGPVGTMGFAAGERELKGIVRDGAIVTAGGATGNADYYQVGEPQHDFADDDVVLAGTSRKVFDVNGAPTAQGPALATWFTNNAAPTLSFGYTAATTTTKGDDIDDDGTDERYGIVVDCDSNPLDEVYQWLKYATRNGETTVTPDGIPGEQYIGGEVYLKYTGSVTGTFSEGADVTQETSGATGVIISIDTTNKVVLLRNVRGAFATGSATDHTVTDNDNSGSVEMDGGSGAVATTFAPNPVAPFGSFAGGTFFGARGVLLDNWITADENSFQLTPIDGGTKSRPQAIKLTVSNLVGTDEDTTTDDRVAIFRLTGDGGQINKEEYDAQGGESIADGTLDLTGLIGVDRPGKVDGGVVRIRDSSDNNQEYRLRFSTWNNDQGGSTRGQYVLAKISPSNLTAGTNTTTIVSTTSELDTVQRGDLVLNVTQSNAVSYVTRVDAGNDTVYIDPPISSQSSTDTIHFNALPIAPEATNDDVYQPLMDRYALSSSEEVSVVYDASIYFRVVARNSAATTKIIPFTTNDEVTSAVDRSNSVVRNPDTIIT